MTKIQDIITQRQYDIRKDRMSGHNPALQTDKIVDYLADEAFNELQKVVGTRNTKVTVESGKKRSFMTVFRKIAEGMYKDQIPFFGLAQDDVVKYTDQVAILLEQNRDAISFDHGQVRKDKQKEITTIENEFIDHKPAAIVEKLRGLLVSLPNKLPERISDRSR